MGQMLHILDWNFTLEKKVPQPVPETESMTIDISEEVADEINEFVENEDGKESEEIETN